MEVVKNKVDEFITQRQFLECDAFLCGLERLCQQMRSRLALQAGRKEYYCIECQVFVDSCPHHH